MKSSIFEVHMKGMQKGSHTILVPLHIAEPFLKSKDRRVKVEASYEDKKVSLYSKLQKDKSGDYRIMFNSKLQKELGIYPTDYFNLQLFEDTSKYGVEMPEELEAVLLSDYDAYQIFESFTPGRQRSIIYSITRYKNPQTKIDKSLIIMDNLKKGITDPKILFKKL